MHLLSYIIMGDVATIPLFGIKVTPGVIEFLMFNFEFTDFSLCPSFPEVRPSDLLNSKSTVYWPLVKVWAPMGGGGGFRVVEVEG